MTSEEMDKLARKLTKQYDQQAKRPRPSIQVNAFYQGCLEGLETNAERIERLEKENAELKAKLQKISDYLANDIPHELMNEATNKIWRMV